MELETAQALARLGMIPNRQNDYNAFGESNGDYNEDSDMGASLRDTQNSFVARVRSGLGIGSVPGHRKGKGPRRLLDNGELNLGRMVEVAAGPPDFVGEQVRILDLRSESELSQFATVTFSILPSTDNLYDLVNYGGPIVGTVEFGNGSGVSKVEVDVRLGTRPYNAGSADWFANGAPEKLLAAPYAGVSISVPGSSIRAYARNDANYTPYPIVGTFGSNPLNVSTSPVKVMAHVSYGTRPSQFGVTRTVWLLQNGIVDAIPALLESSIPPFARSFTVSRFSIGGAAPVGGLGQGIRYEIIGPNFASLPMFSGTVAAGADSPTIPLPGVAESIRLTYLNVFAGSVNNLSLVYNIGV